MSETKHTPGPWTPDGHKYGLLTEYVEDARGRRVAAIYEVDIDNDVEVEANARLIAAAPELLEMVKEFVEYEMSFQMIDKARSLIAKATGEPK